MPERLWREESSAGCVVAGGEDQATARGAGDVSGDELLGDSIALLPQIWPEESCDAGGVMEADLDVTVLVYIPVARMSFMA
jgi:hypothetical protein